MPIETKTDEDWFQIMTQESIISPIWFLFGKNGEEKTEDSKEIIESIQSQFPEIKFYFFDMDQSPDVSSVSSVDRVGTNILYIFGMEFRRFRSINSNIYTAFSTLLMDNFNDECNPSIEILTWDGSSTNAIQAIFEINEISSLTWNGSVSNTIQGSFAINEINQIFWQGNTFESTSGDFEINGL